MSSEKIYLASSWRNEYQPEILALLRTYGFQVYDFRNPQTGGPPESHDYVVPKEGFSWKQTDPGWGRVTPDIIQRYKKMLEHPVAKQGFNADFRAMKWADTCVLLLPSGRSAHLEAGWMSGSGRRLVVYMPPAVGICSGCKGAEWVPSEDPFRNAPCNVCKTDGFTLKWGFEPELMYLIGGDQDLICTTPDELLARLRRPFPPRQTVVWNPETGGSYIVHTERPYPIPNEMLRDPEPV